MITNMTTIAARTAMTVVAESSFLPPVLLSMVAFNIIFVVTFTEVFEECDVE